MALIKCNECGKEISDKAVRCPYCGVFVEEDQLIKCSECGADVILIVNFVQIVDAQYIMMKMKYLIMVVII